MKKSDQEINCVDSVKSRITKHRELSALTDKEFSTDKNFQNQVVKSISSDSRRVNPGAAFFAIPGNRTNGDLHIQEALNRGAKVIVSQSDEVSVPLGVARVKVTDARKSMAKFTKKFYGSPDESLSLIGITGTNGKTTVSTLTRHLLEEPGCPVG